MSAPKLIQIQVLALYARENEDGDIEHVYEPIVFQVTPAEWKQGWDWKAAFETAMKNLLESPSGP